MFLRRGFIHNGVKVAPRQSSFMYTYNKNFDSADKDFEHWVSLYQGGLLYEILLYNQVLGFVALKLVSLFFILFSR